MIPIPTTWRLAFFGAVVATIGAAAEPGSSDGKDPEPRTVKAIVQTRPGGPRVEAEVSVHESPVDLPTVATIEAERLGDDDVVLGVVVDGQAIAYPIRYLARYEVINDRVGETALAPTW
jgi:hypothetical protein